MSEFYKVPKLEFRRDKDGCFQLQFVHVAKDQEVPWVTFASLHKDNLDFYNVYKRKQLRGYLDVVSPPEIIHSEEKAWGS